MKDLQASVSHERSGPARRGVRLRPRSPLRKALGSALRGAVVRLARDRKRDRARVFLPLLALAFVLPLDTARAGCFEVSVMGMEVCNCTSNPVGMDVCQSQTVSTGMWGGVSAGAFGLTAGINGGTNVSTGLSGCTKATVSSQTCLHYVYDLKCCLVEKTTGTWVMKKTQVLLECGVTKYTLVETPARC